MLLPFTQVLFIIGSLAALVLGAASIYSTGDFSFPANSAFPTIYVSTIRIVMLSCFGFGGIWTMFFFHGCNHYLLSSTASLWYFNHENHITQYPFSNSFGRMIKFNLGTVAVVSLIHGLLYILKVLIHLFTYDEKD